MQLANDSLRERGNSLEEEFFRKQNEKLVAQLRETQEKEEVRQHFAAASGVQDPAVIDQLIEAGLTPATVAALALAPLVSVAWADRKLDAREKQAVLQEAESSGVSTGSPEHELLESWLTQEPPASLMDTWSSYAREVSASLGAEQRQEFRERLLERARAVANAAGGFAGIGRMSAAEQDVLDRIEGALEG